MDSHAGPSATAGLEFACCWLPQPHSARQKATTKQTNVATTQRAAVAELFWDARSAVLTYCSFIVEESKCSV